MHVTLLSTSVALVALLGHLHQCAEPALALAEGTTPEDGLPAAEVGTAWLENEAGLIELVDGDGVDVVVGVGVAEGVGVAVGVALGDVLGAAKMPERSTTEDAHVLRE